MTKQPDAALPIKTRLQLPLPVKLSEAELVQRARELSRLLEQRDQLESSHQIAKQAMKEEMAKLDAAVSSARYPVASGVEHRDVDVVEYNDYDNGKVIRIREDTLERIHERAMTPDERQIDAFAQPAARPADDAEPVDVS